MKRCRLRSYTLKKEWDKMFKSINTLDNSRHIKCLRAIRSQMFTVNACHYLDPWYKSLSETPFYPVMNINIFFQIFGLQPWSIARIRAKWKHFYSILFPNFVIFVQIRGMDRVFKPNIRPKKWRVRPSLQY